MPALPMIEQIELTALSAAARACKPRPATTKSAISPMQPDVDLYEVVWRTRRIEQAG